MKTGFRGTFVISWAQTEIDGLSAAPVDALDIGVAWSWRGDAVRVDGPSDVWCLDQPEGADELRARAALMVSRLVGEVIEPEEENLADSVRDYDALADMSFVVTDGVHLYTIMVIEQGRGPQPLLVFVNQMPPRDCDLWIVHHTLHPALRRQTTSNSGVICFTPGTLIATPDGPQLIDTLRPGALVQTKDNGPQPITWVGRRRITGARLFAMPHLRPVRIRAGALGIDRPDHELLVSPEHKMLVKGATALDLFNTPEVLIAAKHLINDETIVTDRTVREVTYIHLMLPHHNVLWANGIETESFHPASADLAMIDPMDRDLLLQHLPSLADDPYHYGGYARRTLSVSEAAVFNYAR